MLVQGRKDVATSGILLSTVMALFPIVSRQELKEGKIYFGSEFSGLHPPWQGWNDVAPSATATSCFLAYLLCG